MQFEYLHQIVVGDTLDVEDIGNCAIQAFSDSGEEFLLIIRTILGWTETFEYGPITPDMKELPKDVSMMYHRREYNEGKIKKAIDSFLNNPYHSISQAMVVDAETAKKDMRNLIDYI